MQSCRSSHRFCSRRLISLEVLTLPPAVAVYFRRPTMDWYVSQQSYLLQILINILAIDACDSILLSGDRSPYPAAKLRRDAEILNRETRPDRDEEDNIGSSLLHQHWQQRLHGWILGKHNYAKSLSAERLHHHGRWELDSIYTSKIIKTITFKVKYFQGTLPFSKLQLSTPHFVGAQITVQVSRVCSSGYHVPNM